MARAWLPFRSFAGYRAAFFLGDLLAGLTLAAIAIPEQMATARLGGFPPALGFLAFVAGSVAFAAFGANRFLSSGADSTITPIFAGGLAMVAATGSPDYATLAAALAVSVGLLLVLSGAFRLGWIADLLSIPVTTGFLVGISFHILVSQLPGILGFAVPAGTSLERAGYMLVHLPQTNPWTLAIGLGVLVVIVVSEWIDPRIPGALIGIVLAVLAVTAFGLRDHGVLVLDTIAVTTPSLTLPQVDASRLPKLFSLALIVTVIVMMQTAATTRSFPSDPDRPPDVDRDFVGVGFGSVLAGLIGVFPVNASPPRTAIVAETGGRSQMAGLIAAAIIVLLVVFGVAALQRIPGAALGGVLLFVAFRIIRLHQIAAILRQAPGEFLLVVITAAAIILLPIEQGVATGIGLSLLHGIWSVTRAHLTRYVQVQGTSVWWPASHDGAGPARRDVAVVGFAAPLSFLNADHFRRDIEAVMAERGNGLKLLVLEATGIIEIDFTAAQMLAGVIRNCRSAGVVFAIARLESQRAQDALRRFDLEDAVGADRIFRSVDDAVRAMMAATGSTRS